MIVAASNRGESAAESLRLLVRIAFRHFNMPTRARAWHPPDSASVPPQSQTPHNKKPRTGRQRVARGVSPWIRVPQAKPRRGNAPPADRRARRGINAARRSPISLREHQASDRPAAPTKATPREDQKKNEKNPTGWLTNHGLHSRVSGAEGVRCTRWLVAFLFNI